MEDKISTMEWYIQVLYDLHWAIKTGMDTKEGQIGVYNVIEQILEALRSSALKIAHLEQEIARLNTGHALVNGNVNTSV